MVQRSTCCSGSATLLTRTGPTTPGPAFLSDSVAVGQHRYGIDAVIGELQEGLRS
jgi:hypothetical protein